ncbi:MAG TPA: DUF5074 domain-containing protein [Balneolales bacterium]|nr:DUF5074 domain-containing protein [Balneolales bacterium]
MKQRILPLVLLGLLFIPYVVAAQQALQNVYVINEGNYGQANASVTTYDVSNGTTVGNAFYKKNKVLLGDVAQSSAVINGDLYILVYGSSKIVVTDKSTLSLVKTINYDTNKEKGPRQMVAVNSSKAYVTNLDSKNISVVDLANNAITSTIPLGSGPEGIVISNGKAYVALSNLGQGDSVAVIDAKTDQMIRKLKVADNPVDVAVDNQGRVWVVCVGNYGYDSKGNYNPSLETFGKIEVIDSSNDSIIKTIDVGGHPGDIALLPSMDRAYYNDGGIVSIDMKTLTTLGDTLVSGAYYSMDVAHDDQTPQLFVADAADYVSSGTIYRYDLTSSMPKRISSFSAGIIPGSFQFLYTGTPLAIEPSDHKPETFTLLQNYPNPFNPTTTIRYHLNGDGQVELNVYSVTGRLVSHLVDEAQTAGEHAIRFDASSLSSGIYFYRLRFDGQIRIRKMVLIK